MQLWCLTREAHAALDGEGARLHGARWNSRGVAVVYAASHLSLAALEYLAHIDPEDAPDDLVALRLHVPDEATELVYEPAALPEGCRDTPPPLECQMIGDHWAGSGEHLLLRVPSVLVPEESKVLVNPAHPEASGVRVVEARPYSYDLRLLDRTRSP